jgi:hypothetical protein
MGRQQQAMLADRGPQVLGAALPNTYWETPRPENHDSHQAAFQSDDLTNRRMRARMSGGVGGDGATPSLPDYLRKDNSAAHCFGSSCQFGGDERGGMLPAALWRG